MAFNFNFYSPALERNERKPIINIYKNSITISKTAGQLIKDHSHVLLGYDPENNVLLIKPSTEGNEGIVSIIRPKSGTATIRAKNITGQLGIDLGGNNKIQAILTYSEEARGYIAKVS